MIYSLGILISAAAGFLLIRLLLRKPDQVFDLPHGLPLLALQFVHVLLRCAQLGVTQELLHNQSWNSPFISSER